MIQEYQKKRVYRPDIDGLRSIAVLSVVLFHLQPLLLPGGFLGVDVFFVISGYLITSIIVSEHHQRRFSFSNFYTRRLKRIFPALFVVLALSGIVALTMLTPETYVNFTQSGRYAAAQLSNFFFSQTVDYFDEGFSNQPLLHTWSLGVEEQFYLFWPLLIYALFRWLQPKKEQLKSKGRHENADAQQVNIRIAIGFLLLGAISFLLCYRLAGSDYNRAFYMFYTRAFEFTIGGVLALNVIPRLTSEKWNAAVGITGLLLLGYSFLFIEEIFFGASFLKLGVLIPCIGSGMLIFAGSTNSPANRLLARPLPVYIGKISYSLYLYHWPVIIFWKFFRNTHTLGGAESVVLFVISFVLAVLSYHFIEQPVRQSALPEKKTIVSAMIVIICFAGGFKILESFSQSEWRVISHQEELTSINFQKEVDCRKTKEAGVTLFQCQSLPPEQVPLISLIGDSHAPHYLPAVLTWAKKNGYNVKYAAVAGCPMVLGEISLHQTAFDEQYTTRCQRTLANLRSSIVDDPAVELILISQRFDLFYDGIGYLNTSRLVTFKEADGKIVDDHISYYRDRMEETIKEIDDAGKHVVFIKQVPVNNNLDVCNWQPLLYKLIGVEKTCEFDQTFIAEWQQPSIDFVDELCQEHELYSFDPVSYLDEPRKNGKNLYKDKDHLNLYGARYLVPFFDKDMDRIIQAVREAAPPGDFVR